MAGERGGRTGRNVAVAGTTPEAAPAPPTETVAPVEPALAPPTSDVSSGADVDAPPGPVDGGADAVAPPAPDITTPEPPPEPDEPPTKQPETAEPVAEPLTIVTVADAAAADPAPAPAPGRLYDHLLAEAERASAAGRPDLAAALHVADLRLREFVQCLGRAIEVVEHPDLGRRLKALWHLIH